MLASTKLIALEIATALAQILTFVMRVLIFVLSLTLLAIWCTISYDNHYGPTAMLTHYQQIYKKIGIASGQAYPPLTVLESSQVNAYTTQEGITITSGLINFIKNDDEMAMVLGHEMSHYILQHVFSPNPPELSPEESRVWDVKKEENADKLGAFLMMQAGYNICEGRLMWLRMKETYGDQLENDSHPVDIFRFVNLWVPACGDTL